MVGWAGNDSINMPLHFVSTLRVGGLACSFAHISLVFLAGESTCLA